MNCIRNGHNREQLPSRSGLDRDDRDQDDKRTGYGYTRGSKEFEGRRRPINLHGSGQGMGMWARQVPMTKQDQHKGAMIRK